MNTIFQTVLDMTLTASYIIPFVLVARLILKKSPKVYSYLLWSVVFFRLLCPFSFESALSLLPNKVEPISSNILIGDMPNIPTQTSTIDHNISSIVLPQNSTSVNTIVKTIHVWILGIMIMLLVTGISLIRLRKKLVVSQEIEQGVFLADDISSPFVFGLIFPKIYLPSSITTEEMPFILSHERYHLKRFDHITRFLSFIALILHWFNPLVWLAYYISEKDMETSCDEGVLRGKNLNERGDYASILLKFTAKRTALRLVSFSKNDTKERTLNIMKMKTTKLWVSCVSAILVGSLLVAGGTNNTSENIDATTVTESASVQETIELVNSVEVTKIEEPIPTPITEVDKATPVLASNSSNKLEFEDRNQSTAFLQYDIAQLNANKDADLFCENGEHFDTSILDYYFFSYKSDSSNALFAYEVCLKCDEVFYEECVDGEYLYTIDIYVEEFDKEITIYIMCVEPMTQKEIEEDALHCVNLYISENK